MSPQQTLKLNGFDYPDLMSVNGLARLDAEFIEFLTAQAPELLVPLQCYRQSPDALPALELSQWLIDCAPIVEAFIAQLFAIESDVEQTLTATLSHAPILAFKQHFVLREGRRRLRKLDELPSWEDLNALLQGQLPKHAADPELVLATWAVELLKAPEDNAEAIEQVIAWCARALDESPASTDGWVSFRLPAKLDYDQLINLETPAHEALGRQQLPPDQQRPRDGFGLTDALPDARIVQSEVDYCVYCHDKEGDFCSKGFPVKKQDPSQGLKTNPLGEILTGCPLEEKISEMHNLKHQGYSIAALAVIMVDNPMVPATGHRICNDCMKACIYQKQTPVDIPKVETRVLMDVLELPWGVEIYGLLTRWNPLRNDQWLPKADTGRKVAIMGMGPAGFTLAHHLLMAGHSVVGFDGLKIEPLPAGLVDQPIYRYADLEERLDERILTGFGGVAEYGITVRWDKNFLKLIYLTLMRRPRFQVFGNVRFGGTLTVEDVWQLGFDHFVIAVGAGLPEALPIPGSLAPGMRQANDFLMSLQLTGAAKQDSLANLQIRLPAVVVGSGLTAVDAATELQAYYAIQVEKLLARYTALVEAQGESEVRSAFSAEDLVVVDEMLAHAQAIRACRVTTPEGETPNFQPLLQAWGGVTIVYRRRMQDSPAYRSNFEELSHALEEGVLYRQGLSPEAALLDASGHVTQLRCRETLEGQSGTVDLPARCILVATGASPNIAYHFEHRGTFAKQGEYYQGHQMNVAGELQAVPAGEHCKSEDFGPFTSYAHADKRVTFLGDAHPNFHGSVVKAIASAKLSYPAIDQHLQLQTSSTDGDYTEFAAHLDQQMQAKVVSVDRVAPTVVKLRVCAPIAVRNHRPGHFYRLQSFELLARKVNGTRLHMEALSLVACDVDQVLGEMSFYVVERGASSRLVAQFQPGDVVAVMGPSGVRTRVPDGQQAVCFVADQLGIANVLALAEPMRAAGNQVVCLLCLDSLDQAYDLECLRQDCDQLIIAVTDGQGSDEVAWVVGGLAEAMAHWQQVGGPVTLASVAVVHVQGQVGLIKLVQQLFQGQYADQFAYKPEYKAAVHGPMQCMLKGVCAQCLQWQVDPETGQRTKAVFACSWQDEPMELIDMDHLAARHQQNSMQQTLSDLWLSHVLAE